MSVLAGNATLFLTFLLAYGLIWHEKSRLMGLNPIKIFYIFFNFSHKKG
tara:strand:- start:5037 stop:5183 length:147 start_codon:yes stop_codon:yes gene_type:complete